MGSCAFDPAWGTVVHRYPASARRCYCGEETTSSRVKRKATQPIPPTPPARVKLGDTVEVGDLPGTLSRGAVVGSRDWDGPPCWRVRWDTGLRAQQPEIWPEYTPEEDLHVVVPGAAPRGLRKQGRGRPKGRKRAAPAGALGGLVLATIDLLTELAAVGGLPPRVQAAVISTRLALATVEQGTLPGIDGEG